MTRKQSSFIGDILRWLFSADDAAARRRRKPRRRNPAEKAAPLTPADRAALARARRISRAFHGTPDQVLELSAAERQALPRFVPVAGELAEFTYQPAPTSRRGETAWSHESGDRGPGQPPTTEKPLLVVDPKSKRPAIVAHRSPMRFSSKRGFVG